MKNIPTSIIKAAKEYDSLIKIQRNNEKKIKNDLQEIKNYMKENNIKLSLKKFISEAIIDISPGQTSIFEFLK